MVKRLSNTAAVAAGFNGDMPQRTSREVCVEKISNGFVTTESTWSNGNYNSTKTFSEGIPDSGRGSEHGPQETRGSLRDAVDYLRGSRK